MLPLIGVIVAAKAEGRFAEIPEVAEMIGMVSIGESALDFPMLAQRFEYIYKKYVLRRFRALAHCGEG